MPSTINFSGLSSSIQWGDIVDATIDAEKARNLTPITAEIAKRAAQKDAWTKLNSLVETLNENARLVRRTGFGGFTATVPPSPTTSRTLLTASPSLNAVPGRYRVEVLQLADTAKIAGGSVADTSAALNLTGDFAINGTSVAISATDSLDAIRDKINTANSGATPTGVTATIVKEGTTAGRLVLTRDTSGAAGITLTDGTGGMARELGFIDSRSKPVSSAVVAAATALGLAVTPPPATIRVGNTVITVDLATESIASIAAKINAAGGSASVESEQYGSETRYRLVADGNVSAVVGDAGSQDVIDALGLIAGTTGAVSQSVQTGVYTDAADAVATASTLLAGLKVDGSATGLAVGDAINIRGMRGDGTAVTIGLVVGAGDTMQTLLDKINDATTGFGSGARTAVASLGADGRIRLADSQGGASRLSLTLGVTHSNGSAGSLGAATVAVTGRSRELQQGRDAILRVDGRDLTRSSNTITDAIVGTTLNLQTAEPGTSIDVSIDRDVNGGLASVQKLVDSYNAIHAFLDEQRKVDAPLYADTLLRGVVNSFTDALRTDVTANTTYNKLAIAGVALDRFGVLKIDTDKLKTAMADKPLEIEALFGFSGVGAAFVAAADKATQYGIGTISAQLKNLDQTAIRLKTREADAQKRLDYRREQLVAQFTQMEVAISRLNAQKASLTSSINALTGSNN
ncbi:MAG: flagellar filament capping protein FliD [Gemmatimonadaceae bacterium]|nr:flagellar filament capping protein FliD [Gemmatimonadaceae bacterium]